MSPEQVFLQGSHARGTLSTAAMFLLWAAVVWVWKVALSNYVV